MDNRDALEAVSAALTDPHRVVDELLAAADAVDARQRIATALGLSDEQTGVVLDTQFSALTTARRAKVADDLRREREAQGSPLSMSATVSGRVASMILDGRPFEGRGRTPAQAVEALAARVRDEIARPQHRPAIVQLAGVEDLDRFEATHSTIRFYRRDEAADDGS